jgi:hypothetical protein
MRKGVTDTPIAGVHALAYGELGGTEPSPGYLYVQTLSDQAEREADRTVEGMRDAAAR